LDTIAKKILYLIQPNIPGQVPAQSQSQDNGMADAYASPHTHVNVISSPPFNVDFLGFDFLDEWQIGQLDFTGR
jgi:hypothetical protein